MKKDNKKKLNIKEILKKRKWLITLFLSLILLLAELIYLICTGNLKYILQLQLDILYKNLTLFETWILRITSFSVLVLTILTNWISNFIYGSIFPGYDRKILRNTEITITKQIEASEKLEQLIKNSNIDSRDVENKLNKLPFDKGKSDVINTIQNLYQQKEMSLEMREILFVAAQKVFERTDELSKEIDHLKSIGNKYLAETLQKIKIAVEKRKPNSLINIYKNYNKREKENKINLLNELIKSSTTIFAYHETIKFYTELIGLEPLANNHFNFAYFLQKFNFFDEAIKEYEEALKIRRDLAKENPQTYEIDYARMLIIGVKLFKKNNKLKEARRILNNYPSVLQAKRLLEKIDYMEKDK